MLTDKKNPKWWQLYLMLLALVGLFWVETKATLSQTEHTIAEIGILCLIFGFVQMWLRANRSALLHMEEEECRWGLNIQEFQAAQLREVEEAEDQPAARPEFESPAHETKGVLGDTLDWSIFKEDAKVFVHRKSVLQKE